MTSDPTHHDSDFASNAGGKPRGAQDLYAEFQRRRAAGDEVDLEELCAAHPRLANALRALHSLQLDPQAATASLDDADNADNLGALADLPATEAPGCSENEAFAAPLKPGASVGPYRLLDVRGEGGFAIVYRAEQLAPVKRIVALKAIKLGLDTRQVLRRFQAERQVLALLNHSSIAKVFDAGITDDGRPYFVMEFVDGPTLTEYCDAKRLDTTARLELFIEICEAVQHAHQNAIIHRDLKPANVLVAEESGRGVPKIIDFGIAKALSQHAGEFSLQTEAGQVIGTPAYFSPEQAAGNLAEINTRTDIYAMGVILYELLVGRRPLDFSAAGARSFAAVQRIVMEEEPARPSTCITTRRDQKAVFDNRSTAPTQLTRILRGDLDWITMKALAKQPDKRYASASEFAADIRRHLRCEPVLAGPPTLRYRLGKTVRRHRRKIGVLLLLFVAAGATYLTAAVWDKLEQVETSRRLREEGEQLFASAQELSGQLRDLNEDHEEIRTKSAEWLPHWERDKELDKWQEILKKKAELQNEYARAFGRLTQARDTAPKSSKELQLTLSALRRFQGEVEKDNRLISSTAVFFRERLGDALEKLTPFGAVELSSNPPGAEVYCFRYDELESRRIPRAFDPGGNGRPPKVFGRPFLEVGRIWDSSRAGGRDSNNAEVPFLPGDRWIEVDGQKVESRTDLAEAVDDQGIDDAVVIRIRRKGELLTLDWVPFRKPKRARARSSDRPDLTGKFINARIQFGFSFAGYPLEFDPRCRLGRTSSTPVRAELPEGSYLLVFRKAGFRDTRYPVQTPGDWNATVRLFREEDLPPGFVHVPAGHFQRGGDDFAAALQPLTPRWVEVPDFFIGRHEVLLKDYLEFVRDRADKEGVCSLRAPEALRLAARLKDNKISLIPRIATTKRLVSLIERHEKDDDWVIHTTLTDAPLQGVSYLAALEYAHWKTERDGGRWRFRLPTDEEWEKSARGVDGRIYVWGDYRIWSHCMARLGRLPDRASKFPKVRGGFPTDMSVYGVFDLTGSVAELTLGVTRPGFRSCRGASWGKVDAERLRVDTRFGLTLLTLQSAAGIRLVAVPR